MLFIVAMLVPCMSAPLVAPLPIATEPAFKGPFPSPLSVKENQDPTGKIVEQSQIRLTYHLSRLDGHSLCRVLRRLMVSASPTIDYESTTSSLTINATLTQHKLLLDIISKLDSANRAKRYFKVN